MNRLSAAQFKKEDDRDIQGAGRMIMDREKPAAAASTRSREQQLLKDTVATLAKTVDRFNTASKEKHRDITDQDTQNTENKDKRAELVDRIKPRHKTVTEITVTPILV